MSNPTSNFGWQMPTNSDLVTDLPADFEVFGQAVDTSLADLKGGTTGQILSKNSNTDMDFVWTSETDPTAIHTTIVDAKGDLIVGTAADTVSRLAVGTNGNILVADSTAATGVKWAAPSGASVKWTQLGTTTLSSGSSYSFTSLSGYNQLMILYKNISLAGASYLTFRVNSDTGNNYQFYGFAMNNTSATAGYSTEDDSAASNQFYQGYTNNTADNFSGALYLSGCNDSGLKIGWQMPGLTARASNFSYLAGIAYTGTSVVSSMQVITDSSTFDGGTITIYGSVI